MADRPVSSEEQAPDCEKLQRDHEWEKIEYDPSVGSMSSGRICLVCDKFEPSDDDDPMEWV